MKKKENPFITTIDNQDMVKVIEKIYNNQQKGNKKRVNKILEDMKENFSNKK